MSIRRARLSLLAASLAAVWPAAAAATLVVPVGLPQMTREAEVIVHAEVLGQQVTWSKDRARILTLTELKVIEPLKGVAKHERLVVYQVGGTLDGVTVSIPGALRFVPGERMILFAQRFDGMVVSYGMGLGKYRVFDQAGAPWVAPEFGDVAFVRPTGDGRWSASEPPETGPWPLDQFVARLRGILAGGAR